MIAEASHDQKWELIEVLHSVAARLAVQLPARGSASEEVLEASDGKVTRIPSRG